MEAQEYGDMLATLCAGYVKTEAGQVRQPCRDMVAYMVLSGVLRTGPALSKVRQISLRNLNWLYVGLRSNIFSPADVVMGEGAFHICFILGAMKFWNKKL